MQSSADFGTSTARSAPGCASAIATRSSPAHGSKSGSSGRLNALAVHHPAWRSLERGSTGRPSSVDSLQVACGAGSSQRSRRMPDQNASPSTLAEYELELAAREAELNRREGAVRQAEESQAEADERSAALDRRERELESILEAVAAQRLR